MPVRKRMCPSRVAGIVVLGFTAIAGAACGSSSKSSSATPPGTSAKTIALTISESGKAATYSGPSSANGGLVTISLKNTGSMPHGAQFVRIVGKHSPQQALQALGASQQSGKTPSWLRAAGGPPTANPGQTAAATQELPAGRYLIADLGGPGNGPPPFTQLTVTGASSSGSLPSASSTVTAAVKGKDKYSWELAGPPPTVGQNRITFVSKGTATLHLISAVRLVGHPSKAQIIAALKSNSNQPPPFIDPTTFTGTAALDSGTSQVTTLSLSKPGTYLLFCPLHDRDGGKPHFEEGLLKPITVK